MADETPETPSDETPHAPDASQDPYLAPPTDRYQRPEASDLGAKDASKEDVFASDPEMEATDGPANESPAEAEPEPTEPEPSGVEVVGDPVTEPSSDPSKSSPRMHAKDLAKPILTSPPRTGTPMVHLEGIHKAFGKRKILRGVDMAVYPGETVCIIGGSGTGKSVSLKHIMRLLEPDQGRIWLDGEDITKAYGDRLQKARSKLGVNFQFGALLNWLTVFENVALPLRENTDMSDVEIDRRVMAKLELLKIPQARDLYPTQISGGMVKRAGLARAVVMEESLKVILYDEPTSGLDPISTALVDEMVNEMKARLGLTQMIVTHDMPSAYRTADRIAVLYEGKVVQFGTPTEIQNSSVPYVQQFVHGLSTTEALSKSGRFRKSGIEAALEK